MTQPGETRIGWEEAEQKEFLKAIRQPLMVQTPLQLVIENLFQRLQGQAVFMQQMKEKMERIAVKDVTADELLERIKMLESQQGEAAGAKLNPFNQQEILARLEALEARLADGANQRADALASAEGMADLETRLQRLEGRMTGVYNLNGKLVALEQIAGGLGVAIPDLEYPGGGGPPGTPPQAAPPLKLQQAWRPPSEPTGEGAGEGGEEAGVWPSANKLMVGSRTGSPATSFTAGLMDARAGSAPHSPRSVAAGASPSRLGGLLNPIGAPAVPAIGAGGAPAQKLAQMGAEVAALRAENDALKEGLEAIRQQVSGLKSGLGTSATETLSRMQAVEESLGSLTAQLAELQAARREAAARTGSEVSFADFSVFKSSVEAALAEARAQGAVAAALAEKDIPAIASRLEELEGGVKKNGEPRDMDTLFHERINGLEAAIGDIKTEVRGMIDSALEGAAKLEELQALEEVVEQKAPSEAMRLLQIQTHALGQAVTTVSEALASRPELGLGELRNTAANGALMSGPSIAKMRCLTCDQPVKQGASAGGALTVSKGSFLPRLDSMPAKEGPPGGPGVGTADLRASREERVAGLAVGGTGGRGGAHSAKASELEEYANGTGSGRDASPGRQVERSRASRTAVGHGRAGGMHAGKPVFL
ncbi:hypothetical protein HYH03_008502 [Edaphochlamys debaryana]|uniref:Ecto-NOX disulfide-thiol exchanger 1/2 domain-containing protein n=1 Tax=Edaphochlamys debaryana TaxID=47281 RepID=A0A835Y6H8_9CHLO|nr:hypothetical protein HYH03_008502 [Edaphochlamys debaryana]|eukprot:KAG2493370.1 hypothetical protein HYH03_008502 [Edaphochlamys debaryana]